jgi:hypothetical protein
MRSMKTTSLLVSAFALLSGLGGCAAFQPQQVQPLVASPSVRVFVDTSATVFAGYAFNNKNRPKARDAYEKVTFELLQAAFTKRGIDAALEQVEEPPTNGLVLRIKLKLVDSASGGGNVSAMMGFGGGPHSEIGVSLKKDGKTLINENYEFEGVVLGTYHGLDQMSEDKKMTVNPGTDALKEALDLFVLDVADSLGK